VLKKFSTFISFLSNGFRTKLIGGVKFKAVVGLVMKKKKILKAMMTTHSHISRLQKNNPSTISFPPLYFIFVTTVEMSYLQKSFTSSITPLDQVHCNFLCVAIFPIK